MLKLKTKKEYFNLIFIIFLVFGIVLYLHNFLVYPPTRGLDSADHIAYVKYLVNNWRIPKASEGLQMYQPPLYYVLAALFYSLGKFLKLSDPLKLSQLISVACAGGNIYLIYLTARKLFRDKKIFYLMILFSVFLPMHLYESVVLSNEMLISFLSTLAIYYYLNHDWQRTSSRNSIVLGIITGLACLTKYSGLIILANFFLVMSINSLLKKEKKNLKNLLIVSAVAVLISGWFYIRQYRLFGNPLILANDPKLFPYFQEPGYRNFDFYFNLNGLWPPNIFGGQMYSFWGGTYNTVWIDAHHTFLPIMKGVSKAGMLIIYLALIPTVLILIGFLRSVKRLIRKRLDNKLAVLVIFSCLSLFAYIYYTYKLPFGSSIKAFYLLTTILPLAVFFGFGLEKMLKWLKGYRWIIYLEFLVLTLLIYKLYWYQSWWKNIGE